MKARLSLCLFIALQNKQKRLKTQHAFRQYINREAIVKYIGLFFILLPKNTFLHYKNNKIKILISEIRLFW